LISDALEMFRNITQAKLTLVLTMFWPTTATIKQPGINDIGNTAPNHSLVKPMQTTEKQEGKTYDQSRKT
jgi:hypothetical protein